jgi:signal transduction histidine kinase
MENLVTGALNLFRGLNDDEPLQWVDLGILVSELQREFATLKADLRVEDVATGRALVRPQALKRCLTNLITNAIKFGDQATVSIEDGEDLVIRVSDKGPGIPEPMLEKVFEPLFRLESSRNPESGGTGLGLCIARNIAQQHGGSLTLHNLEAGGLQAVLKLPGAARL